MKTYHKEYGITASITDKLDGTARLLVKDQYGRKVKDSIHKNRSAAVAAWRRLCSYRKTEKKMFAIYIEEYGYYEGKIYQNDNEFYPEAEIHSISEFTKIYKTQYLAEKAAKYIIRKCTYVQDFQVKIIQVKEAIK